MMKKSRDVLVIGLALFAMFFGAGNLIFPPQLGVMSGDQWWLGILGFFSTDVGLSILGVIAVAKAGGDFNAFAQKAGNRFSKVMGAVVMLCIGPLLAIPRTGAVSFEMGMVPLYSEIPQVLFTGFYFGSAMLFVLNPKGIVDKVGKWLTPVLLLSLLGIIVKNILSPAGIPGNAEVGNVYSYAFLQGYQTLDGLAAVTFSGVILMVLKEKGYSDISSQVKMTIRSGLVAFGIIGMVYGGLIYLGATGGTLLPEGLSRTQTFMALVGNIFGEWGIWVVAVAVIFACFTTTVGLTAAVSEYFNELSRGKISYKANVVAITLMSFLLANLGVEQIVRFSGPMLGIIYPAIVVLIVLNLFDKYIPSNGGYAGAVGGTLLFSILVCLSDLFGTLEPMKEWLLSLPLGQYEMGWVLPALIGAVAIPFANRVIPRRL
jgi:LIVCS family branched-chain amino acid:cation transporter